LPRGQYLRQLAAGLILGQINHALPAVARPRLIAADGAANSSYKAVQKTANEVARTIRGASSKEHLSIKNLLDVAKMQSITAMVTAAVAMEAWKAFKSSDGTDGSRNPVGSIIFGSSGKETLKSNHGGPGQGPLTWVQHHGNGCGHRVELELDHMSSRITRQSKESSKGDRAGHTLIMVGGNSNKIKSKYLRKRFRSSGSARAPQNKTVIMVKMAFGLVAMPADRVGWSSPYCCHISVADVVGNYKNMINEFRISGDKVTTRISFS
jgi:hypothetical protein